MVKEGRQVPLHLDQRPQPTVERSVQTPRAKILCERCFHGHTRGDLWEVHKPERSGIGQATVRVDMSEESKLLFQNWHRQLSVPYIICAGFEALATNIEKPTFDLKQTNIQKSQLHEVSDFNYIYVRCDSKTEVPEVYQRSNEAEHFLKALQEEECKIKANGPKRVAGLLNSLCLPRVLETCKWRLCTRSPSHHRAVPMCCP